MPAIYLDPTDALLRLGVSGPYYIATVMPFDVGGAGVVVSEQPFDIESPYVGVTNVQIFDISGSVRQTSVQPFDLGGVTRADSVQPFDIVAAVPSPQPGVPQPNPVIAFTTVLAQSASKGATSIVVNSAAGIGVGTTITLNYTPPAEPFPTPSETGSGSGTVGGGTGGGTSSGGTTGSGLPLGDLPGWRQVFVDDFNVPFTNGTFNGSSNYFVYPSTWPDTSGNGRYTPSIISAHDGMLDVHLQTISGIPRVAAFVPRPNGQSGGNQLYGRYAIRFKADPVVGYKTAWLLWPQSENWPWDGEIDFPEGNLNSHIDAFMHRQNATSGSDQDAFSTSATYTSWHTAIIEWLPTRCTFILDGTVIGQATSRIPNTPMHWVVQTETALDGTYPPSSAQGHVYIDWLAIWSYQP